MRICFVADYRSPHARNWIAGLTAEHEVHVISTYPSEVGPGIASFQVIPVGLSSFTSRKGVREMIGAAHSSAPAGGCAALGRLARRGSVALATLRSMLAPADVLRQRNRVRKAIADIQPDLIHAMRIPYEGMMAAEGLRASTIPLVISVWGQDFVIYAQNHRLLRIMTRRAMRRVDGLHADCRRDIRLAADYGLDPSKPTIVLPSGGGLQRDIFNTEAPAPDARARWGIPNGRPVLFNPRNFRPLFVRTREFFLALEQVQREFPQVVVACAGMENNPLAMEWAAKLPDPDSIKLLPPLNRKEMAELFKIAELSVSPSINDGTPNSLLEAMACGAFPVAGDVDSVREWITDGENGLLCDARDPASIAASILRGLRDDQLRKRAAALNEQLIDSHAEHGAVMRAATEFYRAVLASPRGARGLT
jgi:glycosyltransferase involved in cell wall biosynthesis